MPDYSKDQPTWNTPTAGAQAHAHTRAYAHAHAHAHAHTHASVRFAETATTHYVHSGSCFKARKHPVVLPRQFVCL